MNDEKLTSAVIIIVFVLLVLTACISGCIQNGRWQRDAVRQGAAEWRPAPDGGAVFTWTTVPGPGSAVTNEDADQ